MSYSPGKKVMVSVLLVLVLLLGLILMYSDKGVMRLRRLRAEAVLLERENSEILQANQRLLRRIERIKTDPLVIEDEARKKLGFVRENETIYRLSEEAEAALKVH